MCGMIGREIKTVWALSSEGAMKYDIENEKEPAILSISRNKASWPSYRPFACSFEDISNTAIRLVKFAW